ncbi:MAG: hypothetical protein AB2693_21970 [Candidatus Thiodiazotropha sp.]
MHPGYFVEQELKFRVECYEQLHGSYSEEPGSLEDEIENMYHGQVRSMCDENGELLVEFDVPPRRTYIGTDFWPLICAMLKNLRQAVREYAQHECEGCRVNHPSQKYHMLCLRADGEDDWIRDLRYHEPALECLNIYDVMKDWNEELCLKFGIKDIGEARGMSHLSPEEAVEAYKNWLFVKKNQYSSPLTKDWKRYWGERIQESYHQDECDGVVFHPREGVSTYAFESQCAVQGPPAREEAAGCESIHH